MLGMTKKNNKWVYFLVFAVALTSCDSNDKAATSQSPAKQRVAPAIPTPSAEKESSIEAVMVDVPVEDETKYPLTSEPAQQQDVSEAQTQIPNPDRVYPNKQYVQKMLEGSMRNDESSIQTSKQYLENQPKPPKGDKKAARKVNDEALELFNNQQYDQAAMLFAKASQLDPADIEVLNNYGIALMKSGNLNKAEFVLVKTLAIKPGRAPAWTNLGDTLALQGKGEMAVASYLNNYRFSKNRENTHKYFQNQLVQEKNSLIREALAKSTEKAVVMYFSRSPADPAAMEK